MNTDLRWLVVETEHREETIAEQSCAEAGFPTFLPMRRLKDGNLVWMFEGYIFVRANPYVEAQWGRLTERDKDDQAVLRGIAGVLRNAGSASPWCVPHAQWEALRTLTASMGCVFDPWPRKKHQQHGYKRGDVVKIVKGAFADPYGTMERYGTVDWTEKDSVWLVGACFGAIGRVKVPADQVELLNAEFGGDRLAGPLAHDGEHRNRRGGMRV
jgi:transcription antitermination factor NusG